MREKKHYGEREKEREIERGIKIDPPKRKRKLARGSNDSPSD